MLRSRCKHIVEKCSSPKACGKLARMAMLRRRCCWSAGKHASGCTHAKSFHLVFEHREHRYENDAKTASEASKPRRVPSVAQCDRPWMLRERSKHIRKCSRDVFVCQSDQTAAIRRSTSALVGACSTFTLLKSLFDLRF